MICHMTCLVHQMKIECQYTINRILDIVDHQHVWMSMNSKIQLLNILSDFIATILQFVDFNCINSVLVKHYCCLIIVISDLFKFLQLFSNNNFLQIILE